MIEAVDLRRLYVLRLVDEYGTVTAAAETLGLTPSAVSHQMRQLSREIGVDVLEPDGRRVRLTAAGRRLVTHADELHAAWERARADLADLTSGEVGLLRLCAFPAAVAGLLAPAARRLMETAQGVQVHVTEVEEAPVGFDRLLAGEADIAVVASTSQGPALDSPRFDQQPLLAEPLDLLVPDGHPLSGRASVPLDAAAREPWILATPGSWDCYQLVGAACATAGFTPHVVHRAKSPHAVAALVAYGLGVAMVPRLIPLPAHHAVTRVPLEGEPPPQRQILTCVRRGSAEQPTIARGLEALREAARQLPPALHPTIAAGGGGQEPALVPARHVG